MRDRGGPDTDMEPSVFEHEVEYDRLRSAVSWTQVEEYARRLHSSQGHYNNVSKLRHCYAVSELAVRHARVVFRDHAFFAQRYQEMSCRAGGLLHEAIDAGAFFEDVVRAADEAVAQLVASISVDRRVPRPRRLKVYGNQIGLASAAAQVVKLADLKHDHLLLRDCKGPEMVEWAEEAREVLASLGRMYAVPDLVPQLKQLKLDLQSAGKQRRKR